MMLTIEEIEFKALELSADARAELAERLVGSLSEDEHTASRRAWLETARRRRDEIHAGTVQGIPGEEGSALVRQLVGR